MPLRTSLPVVHYFDVVASLLVLVIALGHYFTRGSPASPPLARDIAGVWLPLVAVALLVAFRRRAYRQATPWIAAGWATLTMVTVAAVFWRWSVPAFLAATLGGSILLLSGLVLRTRRLSEPLSRTDRVGLVGVIVSVLLTVALAEGAFRVGSGLLNEEIQQLLRGADPGNFGVAHPYIGVLHTPNRTFVLSGRDFRAAHHTDGLGFRNSWPWPDRADIVTIGDSVTFGQCVEDDEAWPSLIAQHVAPRRLVNLGLIGAGPQQYLRVFETFGVQLRPKLLLVGFFARNDFSNARQFHRWVTSGIGGNYMVWQDLGRPRRLSLSLRHPRESLEQVPQLLLPVFRRSYVYTLVRGLRGGVEGAAPPPPRRFQFENGRSLQLVERDFRSQTAAAQPGRPEFRLVMDALQEIQSLGARQGAHVLIVLLPGKEEVYLPLLDRTSPDPTGALRAALASVGIEHLNLTPDFRTHAAAGEQLFFEVDGHPNRAGQALIARLVHEHIVENAERYRLAE